MLSRNNFKQKLMKMDNQKDHFAIRKLTIGAASVLIGISFMGFGGQAVHADEVTNTQPAVEQVSKETTTDSTQQNNDAQKDVATAQKTEVATDSQANNTKESSQLVKPITEADVKATTESQKAEIADKTNEVKPSDTQVQEKQKEQTSEVKTPDTTSNKDEQKSDQTQSLFVDKKAKENTQVATDIAAEKVQKTVQPQAKIQALIALPAESESQFNVDDWDGSLNNTTHEYTLNNYRGNKENIYIPNTQDFINAGRISSDDKVYITNELMHSITSNGAVNVTVDDQGEKNKVYAKGDWNHAFSGYTTHLQHVDLSHVDTSGVTNMNNLFSGSGDLQSVNFRGCDLSNVTDTSYMFAYVGGKIESINLDNTKGVTREILDEYVIAARNTNKTNLDLSHITLASNITSLHGLFVNLPNLKSVNLSGLDISNVTDMSYMFSGDSNLESLDLSGLDTSHVTNMSGMFSNDPKLTTIKGLENLDTSHVTNMSGMFSNDTSLKSFNLSVLNISHVTDMSNMFSGDSNLESLDLSGLDLSKVTHTDNMFDRAGGKIKSVNITNTKSIPRSILDIYLKALSNAGTTTIDLSGINLSPNVTSLHGLFANMPNLESVNLSGLDISHVTDMSGMFVGDGNLESLDLSGLDLSKVTNINNMFAWAGGKIKSVNLDNTKGVTREILDEYVNAARRTNKTNLDLSHITLASNIDLSNLFANMPNVESIDLTGWQTDNVKNMNSMFNNDPKLTTIKGLEKWDTSHVTDMSYMFSGDSNLESLDLSGLDTSHVTNMSGMFSNDPKLTTIKGLENLDTSHVTNMSGMFSNDTSLKSFNLSVLNISHVTDMSNMFSGDSNLESLDLSGLDLSKVTHTDNMFDRAGGKIKSVNITNTKSIPRSILDIYLKALSNAGTTTIDLSGINLSPNVTSLHGLFANMPNLESVNLSGLDISHVTDMSGMFYNDTSLKSVNLSGLDISHITNMSDMFLGNRNLESLDLSGLDLSNVTDTSLMFGWAGSNMKDVNLDNTKGVTREILDEYVIAARNTNKKNLDLHHITLSPNTTDLNNLFANMPDVESIDLTGWQTDNVKNMNSMFKNDPRLTTIKGLENWDTKNVTDMSNMFAVDNDPKKGLESLGHLTKLDLSKWDTSNVTDMSHMFSRQTNLTSLGDLSKWNTSKVTDMSNMFANMPNVESIDLTGWQTSNVKNMNSMFKNDTKLTTIKGLEKWDTKNVTDMSNMFANMPNVESIDLTGWQTSNVKNMNSMFKNDTKLTTIKGLEKWDTKNVTDMSNMFANMPNVESIDLTGWQTGNVKNMNSMFNNDTKLTMIKGLEKWDTSHVTDMAYMFAAFNNPTTNDYDPKEFENLGHLTKLDLSKWDTSNVTNMSHMFCGQTNLTSLGDLSKWKTSNVTNMSFMFYDLENIPALDLSNWTTDKVTDMSYMFSYMSGIETLGNISNWNTHSVKDMSYMFNGMTNLERLDLSNWDPSSVGTNNTEQNYSLARMFSDDINLTTVGDLYKWADKTGNVHDTRWMFYNTPKLKNVDLHGWNTGKLQIAEGMFWKSGAKHINLNGWDLSGLKRITGAGYVEGSPTPGNSQLLRGNEHMFQDLVNKSVISMKGIKLPNAKNAFTVMDFSGTNPIVVIANGQGGAALNDLLAVNNQTWGNKVTGRQNSDFITYVRADDNTKQIGHHGLNFIFTNLNDLHNYFNKVTNRDAVKADMANDPNGKQLVHDWNAQHDVDGNNIVMTARRVSPDSSYDPYSMAIHDPYSMAIHDVDGKGNMLADLMTSKYQLDIEAPKTTKETKDPTRIIIIKNPDGSTHTKEQTVEFTRSVTKHVDGTEEDTPWTPASGNWDHFDVPQHDGYDSYIDGVAGTSIAEQLVNPDTNDVTIHVTYKSNTPNNPEPDKPTSGPDKPTQKPDKPEPETPDVPKTPDEPNKLKKPTVPKKNDKHKKSNKSENTRPNTEDKAKNKKNSKTQNAGAHGQAAPRAATAPNRLVAPKGDQLATGKGLKELSNKPASAAKANANNKETLPQTGEEKDNVGLLGLGLLALAALGFVDRKRRD